MKKIAVVMMSGVLLLSGCGTYTGQGAYTGGMVGSVLGSAIGGISGGTWRSRDMGAIIGMAGGAMVGAAIGSAADQKQQEQREQYEREREARYSQRQYPHRQQQQQEGYADDRIDFDAPGPRDGRGTYSAAQPRTFDPAKATVEPGYHVRYNDLIEICNARIVDADRDGVIRAGEECRVTFEIMNRSDKVLYDVQPTVFDVTGNKNIHISPNLHVESIAPHSGVRYTATILAGKKLKDGRAIIRVAVAQGNKEITSQMKEFVLETRRK